MIYLYISLQKYWKIQKYTPNSVRKHAHDITCQAWCTLTIDVPINGQGMATALSIQVSLPELGLELPTPIARIIQTPALTLTVITHEEIIARDECGLGEDT